MQGGEKVRSLLARMRAKVDFPVPLEPVTTMTGGAVEEEEGMASVCFANFSRQDPHDFGMDKVGTL